MLSFPEMVEVKARARKAELLHAVPNIMVPTLTSATTSALPLSREEATTVKKEALAIDLLQGRAILGSSLGFSLWICNRGQRLCFGDYGAGSMDC